jgi:hypothetical protein
MHHYKVYDVNGSLRCTVECDYLSKGEEGVVYLEASNHIVGAVRLVPGDFIVKV